MGRTSFATDVRPMLAEWRERHGLAPDPLQAHRASGYVAQVTAEREATRRERGEVAATAYA
jgi:L-rhamnose isomerase